MSARVRTITPGGERNPVKRYQAGCIPCDWWGMRFRVFQRAVNQMERHNVAEHSPAPGSGEVR